MPADHPPRIFLIGPRGSGKTTVARRLADRLGWSWLDADLVLEQRWGQSIRALFAAEGEESFRDREALILAELCQFERHVLATGGGVVVRPANRELLRASGWVVWLKADADTLWQRLQADAATAERRPPLSVGGHAEIIEVLRQRQPHYQSCASLVVDTAGRSPDAIVDEIVACWPPAPRQV